MASTQSDDIILSIVGLAKEFGGFRAVNGVGQPVRLDGEPPRPGMPPPTLGQHTDAVLAELGFAAHEVRALRRSGAVA